MLTLDKAQAITRAMPSLSPPQLRVVSLLSKLKGPIRFFPGLTRANSELTVLLDRERGALLGTYIYACVPGME
jgi:hypothetical protein